MTSADWEHSLAFRKKTLQKLLEVDAPISVIADQCRLVLSAYYRSRYIWLLRVFGKIVQSDYRDWKARQQIRVWKKQGLSEEEIESDITYGDWPLR